MTAAPVNAWSGSFFQPATFGPMPPQLQSVVVPLNAGSSVGGGSGTSSATNWLFCLVTSNQNNPLPTVTFSDGDDIHSFWRPEPTSPSGGLTRTSVWYTPNIARQVNDVYIAPNGLCGAISVLVVEVGGLGPWDTVTGFYPNFANAATSLNLALAAPSASAFLIAAAGGDSDAVSQAFAPAAWTPLATVTSTNGVDHTCDAVLTSACLVTSGAVSVNATTSGSSDLSGVILGVLVNGANPISGAVSAGWASRTVVEFAPGYGFLSPPDEIQWVTISDSARTSPNQGTPRFWGWSDKSAIPWGLGQLQSASGAATLDNFDGNLSPSNPGGLWYSTALNQNMSFQSGVAPWTAQNGATLVQSSAQAFASSPAASALYSAQVTPNGSTALPGIVSEQDTAAAGSVYSASAWFYSAAGWATGAQVAVRWINGSGGTISTSTATALAIPAATWTQVTLLNQTAPALTAGAKIIAQFAGTPSATPFFVAEAALNAGASAVTTGLLTAGVPVRLRLALGTIKGTAYNRWYVISRFANSWPEKRTPKSYRGYVEAGLTDTWSIASASCATPYRGEVEVDGPGWWWPTDDQPLTGGVLPTSLRNAARGSTTVLNIVPSPSGVVLTNPYTSGLGGGAAGGTDLAPPTNATTPGGLAVYSVAQAAGWNYGDPQVSPQSAQTGNPVTAQPGSAAWQQAGLLGNTGAQGWTLIANDTFPSTSGGLTVSGWFNPVFFGTAATAQYVSGGTVNGNVAGQPYCPLSLLELATGSGPLAVLQLDMSGHLQLSINGGGSIAIYTSSDLRAGAWFKVSLQLTATGYTVRVNAGLTASVSGSASVGTVAPAWLIANGDLGSHGGSSAGTGLVHGWNGMVSDLQVYPFLLPLYRELAHYAAAVSGFGLLPAPSGMQVAGTANSGAGGGFTPDGEAFKGAYGFSGENAALYSISALAVTAAGSYTSGPAARIISSGLGKGGSPSGYGPAFFTSWTALGPLVKVYTSASVDAETEASAVLGSNDTYTAGYGSGATGVGPGHVSGGTGASPPSGPSALGDAAGSRIERILGYGGMAVPRAIDQPASLVQAAIDVGGQQAGANVQAIVSSDAGWLTTDNPGLIFYKSRPHLNADTPVWQLGPNVGAGQIPYDVSIGFGSDQQKTYTAITVAPYAPDGSSPADIVPSDADAVQAAQQQYGVRPLSVRSYLQSASEQQAQADWLLGFYGTMRRRVETLVIDAAKHPGAWVLVAGCNLGDLAQVSDMPFGAPVTSGVYRVSSLSHQISGGANGNATTAAITLVIDPVPPGGYFT